MNSNLAYQLKSLGQQNDINIYGVQYLDNKKFMFWFKNNSAIKRVRVVLEANNENIQIQDGTVILSLKGLNSHQDLRIALMIFIQIMRERQINNLSFQFIVANQNQADIVATLAQELGIPCTVQTVTQDIQNENVRKVEESLNNNNNITANGSKTIELDDAKGLRQVTITADGNAAYENVGPLNINEQKKVLLQEWQQDPFMSVRIRNLDERELDDLLTENITNNLTTHRMEAAYDQTALANDNHKVGQAAMDKATAEDGRVNTELGIVENNVTNHNQYSAVEQNNNGNINIVNPNVTSSQISSGGVVSSSNSNNTSQEYVASAMTVTDEQTRELTNEFYVDEEYNVYNGEGQVIGKIGSDYLIDYNDNSLYNQNGQKQGYLGDINDMGKTPEQLKQERSNVKKLMRVKPNEESPKSAAFANLAIIIFILSAFLLIGSALLLFVFS